MTNSLERSGRRQALALAAALGWAGWAAVAPQPVQAQTQAQAQTQTNPQAQAQTQTNPQPQALDPLELLRSFVREAKAGQADFTQTVRSPDGAKTRVSTGHFEFARPDRFRFTYLKPYPQTIVSDGQKVWFHDPDLNQVTVRKLADALGSTPAALLAGGQAIERDFTLQAQPERDGLAWVLATPRQRDGTIQWLRIGFQGRKLAALEMADSFGQRSALQFSAMRIEASLPAETFRFRPPPGADISGSAD